MGLDHLRSENEYNMDLLGFDEYNHCVKPITDNFKKGPPFQDQYFEVNQTEYHPRGNSNRCIGSLY